MRVSHDGVLDQLGVDVGNGSEPAEGWGRKNILGVGHPLYPLFWFGDQIMCLGNSSRVSSYFKSTVERIIVHTLFLSSGMTAVT